MKKLGITLLVILAVCGVAVISCPDRQAHKDAIMSVLNEKINDSVKTSDQESAGWGVLFGSIGSTIADFYVDKRLLVKNNFLWSVGEIQDLNGDIRLVSIGVFGHVFTAKKEDLDKALSGQ